jgi:hypothetical protein
MALEVKDKRLTHLMSIIEDWRKQYHVDKNNHDIVFQNRNLYTNARFTNNSLNAIRTHPKGFENIPHTISSPDEVWSKWQNADSQKVVLRSYIQFGKGFAYVVLTQDGHIEDAFAVSSGSVEKYRKGVLLSR